MKKILALLALMQMASACADTPLQQLYACMHANIPGTLRVEDIELETTPRNGAPTLIRGRLYEMLDRQVVDAGLIKIMVSITEAGHLSGTALLMRQAAPGADPEMYVFLPAIGRVRRIIDGGGFESMFRSNFSYADFKQVEAAFDIATAKLEAPEELEHRPTQVISFRAKSGQGSPYSGTRLWVDRQTCLPLKADFYVGAAVRKQLLAPPSGLRQSGTLWYASRVEARDLQDGSSSVLRVVGVSTDARLPLHYFDPKTFFAGN